MQKDYWKMSEEELTKLAEKYHVPPHSAADESEWPETFFDRPRVIAALVARDTARRASWTLAVAILALIVSLAAFTVSLATLGLKYNETVNTSPSQTIPSVQH